MENLNYIATKKIIEKIMTHPRFDETITGLDLAEFAGAVFIIKSGASAHIVKEQRVYLLEVWKKLEN